MKINTLTLYEAYPYYTAVFTGTTGTGEKVQEEEAHGVYGVQDALNVWGATRDNTIIYPKGQASYE